MSIGVYRAFVVTFFTRLDRGLQLSLYVFHQNSYRSGVYGVLGFRKGV